MRANEVTLRAVRHHARSVALGDHMSVNDIRSVVICHTAIIGFELADERIETDTRRCWHKNIAFFIEDALDVPNEILELVVANDVAFIIFVIRLIVFNLLRLP